MPAPGAERIVSRPPSRAARSSIEVSPSRRDAQAGIVRVEADAVVGDLEHEPAVVAVQPDARRARRPRAGARSAAPPARSGAPRRRASGRRGTPSARSSSISRCWRRRSTSTCLRSALAEPVSLEVGRTQLEHERAQLVERLLCQRLQLRHLLARGRGSRSSSVAAASALSTSPNSFWLTASWRSSASRFRSARIESSRLCSYRRAFAIAIAACAASSSISSSSSSAKSGAADLLGQVERADHALGRDDRHAEERAHVGVPARPPAAEARVLVDVARPVRLGRLEHRAEHAVLARERAERGDSASLMPEVRKRRKPPSPSGSPSAAKRAPASSRASSTSRCSTSSTESPAATASTASLTAFSVGLTGLATA